MLDTQNIRGLFLYIIKNKNTMKWNTHEIEILKKYTEKEILLDLLPNRTWNSIRKKNKKINPAIFKSCKKWTNEEIHIINENYEKSSKEELMGLLTNRSWTAIKLKSNFLGLNRTHESRNPKMDKLLLDTIESFYWIGFILADGHIHNKERLKLELSSKDSEHLNKFCDYVECENISINDITSFVTLQNKEICKKIVEKFNIENNKTENPPELKSYKFENDLIFSLIVGFIDGDGSIGYVHNRKDCNLRIRIHKNWLSNLEFIEDFIYEIFNYKKEKYLTKITNDGYAFLNISNNEVLKLMKLKSDELKIPLMKRKWEKIDLNKTSRIKVFLDLKNEILKLYSEGFSPKDIISFLGIKKGVVYKHIRNYKSSFNI